MSDTTARPVAGSTPTLEERLRDHFLATRQADSDLSDADAVEVLGIVAERERLEAENARLRLTIYELMEDLEAEIRERYNVTDGSDPHPALQRKFDRDIEPVYRARQQLRALTSAGEGEPSDG
jgi:hypothetical protein